VEGAAAFGLSLDVRRAEPGCLETMGVYALSQRAWRRVRQRAGAIESEPGGVCVKEQGDRIWQSPGDVYVNT